jgi:cytochrome c2
MRVCGRTLMVLLGSAALGCGAAHAAEAEAGKRIFQTVCRQCHAALPYTGRIGVENLPKFLANPRRCKPTTAMTFPGLRSQKDIDDIIAYITANQ